jgi:hypothetical protein
MASYTSAMRGRRLRRFATLELREPGVGFRGADVQAGDFELPPSAHCGLLQFCAAFVIGLGGEGWGWSRHEGALSADRRSCVPNRDATPIRPSEPPTQELHRRRDPLALRREVSQRDHHAAVETVEQVALHIEQKGGGAAARAPGLA